MKSSTTRRRSRWLALAAAGAAVALALAGCSTSQSSSTPKSQKLTVWDWQYSSPQWGKALKTLDAEFEKANPGVKINHVAQPFSNYDAVLRAAFTAKSGPDAVMFLPGSTGVLAYQSSLVPLNSRITSTQRKTLTGWDVVSQDYDASKNTYAVPFGNQGIVFYYNKSLFAKAGLDPNKPPTSYDQLVADAKTLKAAGITPFGGGNKEGYENDWWFTILAPSLMTKQQTFDLAANKIKFTSPVVEKVTTEYTDLVKDGYFNSDYLSLPLFTDGVASFQAGKEAMFLGLPSSDASYVQFDSSLGASNVGVFEAPAASSGGKPNFLPYSAQVAWGIPKFSTKQALAYKYITFLTSKAGAQEQFTVGGVLPNNTGVTVGSSAPPQVKQILADLKAAKALSFPPHGLWTPAVGADHEKQLNLTLAGQQTVQQALTAVQATQDRGN
jgi:multiple sugar transport system substrate-binding protein